MKRWKTLNKYQVSILRLAQDKNQKYIEKIIEILLSNRGLKTKRELEEFLNPRLEDVTIKSVGIDKKQLVKAVDRIRKAIENKEKIVVFGDYDVDGICGTAILWETLHSLGAKVMPYIPHRVEEGYGLSLKGIKSVILNLFQDLGSSGNKMLKQVQHDNRKRLIITVDNGIVANDAVSFANKKGIDVIITDHHVPSRDLPSAYAIVHTTKLCGAGVAWILSNVILNSFQDLASSGEKMLNQAQPDQHDKDRDNHLELVALATIADLVPLIGANRMLVKFGLKHIKHTNRIGLLELFKEAGIEPEKIGVYEIGHIIAPRINAMGRLDYAMDSLRLLCTNNRERAKMLAQKLGSTNRERQTLTIETVEHAIAGIRNQESGIRRLLFVAHGSYQQGVIGLVAGKLVEEFYKPAIVVSVGEKYSKGSARSINGFNIIEFIRSSSEMLVDAGGHPMAAGFTVETEKLSLLQKMFEERANELLDEEMLKRTLRIDCNLPLEFVSNDLYDAIQRLAPFGMGNPEPTFVSRNVEIEDMRAVGMDGKHIKLRLSQPLDRHSGKRSSAMQNERIQNLHGSERFWISQNDKGGIINAIAFGMGARAIEFHIGDKVDVVYTIDEDTWNGNKKLQLKVKDLKVV